MHARDYVPYVMDILTTGHQSIDTIVSMVNGPRNGSNEDFRPSVPLSNEMAIRCLDIAMQLGFVRPLVTQRDVHGNIGCGPTARFDIHHFDVDETWFELTDDGRKFHDTYIMRL